ncbi:hypothetical protein BAE44_0010042 [Dichanthelium oligosanthes]|uniref:F-box domain-containing protein n=1 Tax=Dichanthelium oligosanthes TaxID=888268 RepID=A0A1E5VV21_9POAL|nr:hypothetical protein BAE44_0010042 [Dichanthelium oligosanthes]
MQSHTKKCKTQLGDVPAAAAHVHVPEEIVAEILALLPGKSVLRFHAVCRAWRRITTDPAFLAAHARLRPLEVVLYSIMQERPWRDDPNGYSSDIAVESIPVSGDQAGWRRLFRYPEFINGENCSKLSGHCLRIASCSGVLLFRIGRGGGRYLICNPVTRQWAHLPRLQVQGHHIIVEYGFYFHQPSGEYRLQCHCQSRLVSKKYYIVSAGGTEPRQVSMADADEAAAGVILSYYFRCMTPVDLHDHLHWLSAREMVVAFDTASETFHVMPAPPTSRKCVKLFDMDGLLAVSEFGETQIDL